MNQLLITPTRVNALAFANSLDPTHITDTLLLAAQERYIRPCFAECYDALTSGEEPYRALLDDYIQPSLAQYIRADILPSIATATSNSGLIQYGGTGNTRTASDTTLNRLVKISLRNGNTLLRRAIRYAVTRNIIKQPHKSVLCGVITPLY